MISEGVPPIPKQRHHKVSILGDAWNWTKWFADLPLDMHGHTGTAAKKAENQTEAHVFRFLRRDDVDMLVFQEVPSDLPPMVSAWGELPPDPSDVILLTKKYIGSVELSQPPMVFCPSQYLQALRLENLAPAPLAVLSER